MFLKIKNHANHVSVSVNLDKRLVAAGAFSSLAVYLYSRYFERQWVEVTRHKVEIKGLAPSWHGFRFAWMSDLHLGFEPSVEPVKLAFTLAVQEKPDLILLGGDYLDRGRWKPICDELFTILGKSGIPIYGVWGNHDYFGNRLDPHKNFKHLEAHGIHIKVNEVFCLEHNGVPGYFAGLDDSVKGVPEPHTIRAKLPPGTKPLVALCHNPNYVRRLPADFAEIILSGHTHGGQLNPLPLHRNLNWLQYSRGKHHSPFPTGWYEVNGSRLYTGRGVGTTHWGLRFGARPELAIFELCKVS
jgi:predicted MPP superfamily phosphohydrolase